jgi:hypothetical protein
MAPDPETVTTAADHYGDYQTRQMTGGSITAQYAAVTNLHQMGTLPVS